jgi:hypothetical protein
VDTFDLFDFVLLRNKMYSQALVEWEEDKFDDLSKAGAMNSEIIDNKDHEENLSKAQRWLLKSTNVLMEDSDCSSFEKDQQDIWFYELLFHDLEKVFPENSEAKGLIKGSFR